METVTVNGVDYEAIERENKYNKQFSTIMAMAAAMGSMAGFGGGYERKLPQGIDIVKEFELIQQKKSRLSKWERDAVEAVFNRTYKQIQP